MKFRQSITLTCSALLVIGLAGCASSANKDAMVAANLQTLKKHERSVSVRTAGGAETTGALLIRNSWGAKWGEGGYGWLPYDYVLKELALDWWSLVKAEWIDTGEFGTKA